MTMKPLAIAIQAALGTSVLLGCATPGVTPHAEVNSVLTVRGAAQARDYYVLGRHFHAQGQLTQAVEAYRKALALDAGSVDARNGLGTVLAAAGDYERAIAEFDAAIAADPGSALSHNNRGFALQLQQRHAEAIESFQRAASLDPANVRTWNNLGTSLARLGEQARADEAFARARDVGAAPPDLRIAARAAPAAPVTPVSIEIAASPQARAVEGPITLAPSLLVPIVPAHGMAPTPIAKALVDAAPLREMDGIALTAPPPDKPAVVALALQPVASPVEVEAVAAAMLTPIADPPAAIVQLQPYVVNAPVERVSAAPLTPIVGTHDAVVQLQPFVVNPPVERVSAALLTPIAGAKDAGMDGMVAVPEGLLFESPEVVTRAADPLPPATAGGRYAAGTIRQVVVVPDNMPPVTAVAAPAAPFVDATIVLTPVNAAEPPPALVTLAPAAAPESLHSVPVVAAQAEPMHAAGTVVTEVPSGAEVVAINSAVAELRWTGTVVQARPATIADATPVPALRFEVSNGNGITGLARKVARLFAEIGLPRARLTNHKPFTQRISVIQYRAGHRDEALALSERLPGQPAVVPADALRAGIDVRLVLGHDVPRDVALVPGPDMQASRTERRSPQPMPPR